MTSEDWKIVGIVGPTSSNKTELSIELADILKGEIISADSRQIYKDLYIGTGKPRPDQLDRIKHYLISAVSPEGNKCLPVSTNGRFRFSKDCK
jgi:tRNA dimethylallyltransferase